METRLADAFIALNGVRLTTLSAATMLDERAPEATESVAIAKQGLAARGRINWDGENETRYLRPLEEIVATGRSVAEDLLERYHGPWGGSVDPVYEEYAF